MYYTIRCIFISTLLCHSQDCTVRDPFTIWCVKCTVCKKKNNNLLSCTWSMMWLWSSVFSFLKNCFWLEIITNKTSVLAQWTTNFNFSPLQEWNWLARLGNGACLFPALHILYLSQISINQQNYHLINKFVAELVNTQFSSLKHCTAEEKYILQKSYKEVHVQCTVCIMICMQNTTNIILNLWVLWVHPNGIFHLIFVHRGFFHLFTI